MFQSLMVITAGNKYIFKRYFMAERKKKRKRKSIYSFIVMAAVDLDKYVCEKL